MTQTTKTRRSNRWLGGESPGTGGKDERQTRWLTPPSLVQALGHFDLDPCGAPGHEVAVRTYNLEDGEDGLSLPWHGIVWLNPPYGRQMAPFMRRLVAHGDGMALIFARTETAIFHETVWGAASSALFLRGRVRFLDANGVQASANSGAPSVVVAYGDKCSDMLHATTLAGHVVRIR